MGKYRFGSKKREAIWQCERLKAYLAGCGDNPICNICDQPVTADQSWDISHLPHRRAPLHLRTIGVAHRPCNHVHNNREVTPAIAQERRIQARAAGRKGPGLGRHPMPGGRLTRITKTMTHGVRPRQSLAEKHAATMAKRGIAFVPSNPEV